jgi:hypothetical protein
MNGWNYVLAGYLIAAAVWAGFWAWSGGGLSGRLRRRGR